jgi:hypothetical protein
MNGKLWIVSLLYIVLSRIWDCTWLIDGFWLMDIDLLHSYTTCCYTSQTTTSLFSAIFECRLNSQLTAHLELRNPIFSTELLYITTLHGPTRKHNFQQCHYYVFNNPLLRNGGFYCCVFIFSETCLPSRCLAMNYSGFQASCHSI